MRTITHALLALGFVGAMAVSTPIPAKAQQVNLSGTGVEMEIVTQPDRDQNYRRYRRDFGNYFAFDRRPHTQRYYNDGFGYSTAYTYPGVRRAFDLR